MKKIVLLLLSLVLVGCAQVNDINVQLDDVFADENATNVRANNYTEYIEYYMPSDVNELDANKTSYVFYVDDCKFIMNINVSHIINSEYYGEEQLIDEGYYDNDKLIYEHNGSFKNLNDEDINYFFKAYQYEDKYLLYLLTSEVELHGYSYANNIGLITRKMFMMAKANNVKNDIVINNFSNKDIIDYQKSTVNLFDSIFPVDGRIDDLMINQSSDVSE